MKSNFRKKVLKNGMTILFEKRNVPVVSVSFAVRQGGINESSEEKGISHFIEHLLYKGTSKRNWFQLAEEIEKNGGQLNGGTSEIMTMFFCKMPSNHLDTALDVLSDMVKNPLFDKDELEKERKVIFEEIKMYRDNPRRHSFEEIQKLLFKQPFGSPLIGDEKTLKSLDREKIFAKFEEVYKPNNMILAVVGDCKFEKLVDFAEKNFSSKTKGKIKKLKIVNTSGTKTDIRDGVDQANLVFAYHVPPLDKKNSHAAKILSALMADGLSSRLFLEIREKRNLAYAVSGDCDLSKEYAYSFVYVGTKKENVELVKKLILEEFDEVSRELTEKELNQIKNQLIGQHNISMEDSQSQMLQLLYHEVEGSAEDYYDFEKKISQVKLEDVKRLAKIKDYSFYALLPRK